MIDAVYALFKLGLEPGMSVTRAITTVGLDIGESTNQLAAANKIVVAFGGKAKPTFIEADIFAKALVEQAVILGEKYNPEEALAVAGEKFAKIQQTLPHVFTEGDDPKFKRSPSNSKRVASKRGGDKKVRALEIFNRESGKSSGEVAKMIASELEITYANAYYYVSRVFNVK